MKKELNLKHGVILAAAVLLIAGIAFAGAAAADPVYKDWTAENITSAGGDFIINPLQDGNITGLYLDEILTLTDSLTLDFGYQTVRLNDSGLHYFKGGVLGVVNFSKSAYDKVLTIKNLNIDGGSLVDVLSTNGDYGYRSIGSVIGTVYPFGSRNNNEIYIENISINGVDISGEYSYGAGGIVGINFVYPIHITNCSVRDSTIMRLSTGGGLGGCFGSMGNSADFYVNSSSFSNCLIMNSASSGSIGGLVGDFNYGYGFVCNDVIVENCAVLMMYPSSTSNCGGLIGGVGDGRDHTISFDDVIVKNSVIYGGSNTSGVLCITKDTVTTADNIFDIHSTVVDHCTIIGNGYVGGFMSTFASIGEGCTVDINSNTVSNTCVVSTSSSGIAAGFIAKNLSA